MPDLAELQAQLAELKRKRASGNLRVRIGDREVYYKSDVEMRAAIASLEYEINAVQGASRPRNVVFRAPPDRGF